MKQTTLCVPLEVKPESCSRLSSIIEQIRTREDKEHSIPANFTRVIKSVPTLHFMSMSVFTATEYDPLFILEANFDGAPGVFWGQLEALCSEEDDLRAIIRCCKRPLDDDGPLYDAIVAPGSRAPVSPFFEARTQEPSVFHHGNRGLTRDRILREAALFKAVREEIDKPGSSAPRYRALGPGDMHAALRRHMLQEHSWLREPAPERIGKWERVWDFTKLLVFGVTLILLLSLPGVILSLILPTGVYIALMLILATLACYAVYRMREALPGTDVPTNFSLVKLLPAIAIYVLVAVLGLIPAVILVSFVLSLFGFGMRLDFGDAFWLLAPSIALGLLSLLVVVPLLVLWLRHLERRDSSHDAPSIDQRLLREMIRREDWVAQNHMGSIVLIKPGILRMIIIRAGHLGLGLLLRFTRIDGYLGSMRTVHFAHWAFLNNGSRLLFFSNFDQSWDSYLDDFIEKAHSGLTLAWSCGVGFPPTRFLIYDGASHGRRFKNWALASRAVSRFWYSAYPKLTVDQIERNYRIAIGLHRESLNDEEARAWMRDL